MAVFMVPNFAFGFIWWVLLPPVSWSADIDDELLESLSLAFFFLRKVTSFGSEIYNKS